MRTLKQEIAYCRENGFCRNTIELSTMLAWLGERDRAGLVLATIEGEDSTEDAELQEIIDGISTWAAPAILGEVKGSNVELSGPQAALSPEDPART